MDVEDEYATRPLNSVNFREVEMAYHQYLQQKENGKPNPHIMTFAFVIMLSGIFLIYIELEQMEACDPDENGGTAINECEWEKTAFKLKWGGLLVVIVSLIFIRWNYLQKKYKNSMSPKLRTLAQISQMPPTEYDQLEYIREMLVLEHVESILNQD